MLRNDFKLNIIKQQQVDIDQLIQDGLLLEELQLDLRSLLEELESLVDAQLEEGEEIEAH